MSFQFQHITNFTLQLAQTRTLQDVANLCRQTIDSLYQPEKMVIVLPHPVTFEPAVAYTKEIKDKQVWLENMLKSKVAHPIANGEFLYEERDQADLFNFDSDILSDSTVRSIAFIPIKTGSVILGFLGLAFKTSIPSEELNRIQFIANQVAFHYSLLLERESTQDIIQTLNHSRIYYKSLFDAATEPIIVHQMDGAFLHINKKFYETFKFETIALKGLNLTTFLGEENQESVKNHLDAVKINEQAVTNVTLMNKEAEKFRVKIHSIMIKIGEETIIKSAFSIIEDVQPSANFDSQFISNLVSELKQSYGTTLGFTQSLKRDKDMPSAVRNDFIDIIYEESSQIGKILDELDLLIHIELGQHGLDLRPVDIKSLITEMVHSFRPIAELKGQHLTITAKDSANTILGDKESIAFILSNLLNNAFKFTDRNGQIEVKIYNNGEVVFFEVSDSGGGIPKEDIDHIFDVFFRSGSEKKDKKGIGLGLAITKKLVELNKGSITVDSTLGKGTTIKVALPKSHNNH